MDAVDTVSTVDFEGDRFRSAEEGAVRAHVKAEWASPGAILTTRTWRLTQIRVVTAETDPILGQPDTLDAGSRLQIVRTDRVLP